MYKKFISLFLSTLMCLSLSIGVSAEQEEFDGYVYFTAERITLGQGFIVEPVKVGFYKDESLDDITKRALGDKAIYETSEWGRYLKGIADGGEPSGWTSNDIPADIKTAVGSSLTSRTESDKDKLLAVDYCPTSGWMFTIDETSPSVGSGSVTFGNASDGSHFTNGSVVRLQFSVYGYGEDIGQGWGYYPFTTSNTFADKSELIRLVAEINDENAAASCGESYINAVAVLSKWDASADEIANAIKNLENAVPTPAIKTEATDSSISVDISSLRSMKVYIAFYNADGTLNTVRVHDVKPGDTQISEPTVANTTYRVFIWSKDMQVIK